MKKTTSTSFISQVRNLVAKHGKITMLNLEFTPEIEGCAATNSPFFQESFRIVGSSSLFLLTENVTIQFKDGYIYTGYYDFTGSFSEIVKFFKKSGKTRFKCCCIDDTGRSHKFGRTYKLIYPRD